MVETKRMDENDIKSNEIKVEQKKAQMIFECHDEIK
jgi:hypothetical protein